LISRGLLAGLYDDFTEACHLLVPQVEHSIRRALNDIDVITTSLGQDGVQDEIDLRRLLEKPEATLLFGEGMVFELRELLVERFGSNYRNLLAHGLLNSWEVEGSRAEYVWWLALRFYCLPILNAIQRAKATAGDGEYSI